MVTPTKPLSLERVDREETQFWQGVRASPARAARDIRSRFKDIDRRLADIESYVTTENRSLAREIEALAIDTRRSNAMMGPAEVFIALIVIGLPVMLLMIIANRFFKLREKKLEVEAEWPPRRPPNMPRARMSSKSASGCWSRS